MRIHARLTLLAMLIGVAISAFAQPSAFGSCPVFPGDHIWNTPVEQLPVSPSSSIQVNTIGATSPLHPDFGSGTYNASQTPQRSEVEGCAVFNGDTHVVEPRELQETYLDRAYRVLGKSALWLVFDLPLRQRLQQASMGNSGIFISTSLQRRGEGVL